LAFSNARALDPGMYRTLRRGRMVIVCPLESQT
jgi:hypothetical protein